MPPLVLMQTTVSNADMRGMLRCTNSQTWELEEPTLRLDPYVFSEICWDRRPSCLPSVLLGSRGDRQVLAVEPRRRKTEEVSE